MDVFTLRQQAELFNERFADLDYYRQEVGKLTRQYADGLKSRSGSEERADTFEQLLHASVWTMFVSLADVEVRNLARHSSELFDPPVRLRHLAGSWSDRARIYFVRLIGVPDLEEADWEAADACFEIRNCWVHNLGQLEDFKARLSIEKFVRSNGAPAIVSGELRFSEDSSIEVAGALGRVLSRLWNGVASMVPGALPRPPSAA